MQEKELIKKVATDIYIDTNKIEDNYCVFGLSMPNIIYSHMTALYFHGLSIEVLTDVYDITVKRSYNSVHLRKHNVFYVDNDIYELGLTIVETLFGNKVKTYDLKHMDLSSKKILVNKIQCKKCKDIIEYKHVHDFKWCSCKSITVDDDLELGDFENIIELSEFEIEQEITYESR